MGKEGCEEKEGPPADSHHQDPEVRVGSPWRAEWSPSRIVSQQNGGGFKPLRFGVLCYAVLANGKSWGIYVTFYYER